LGEFLTEGNFGVEGMKDMAVGRLLVFVFLGLPLIEIAVFIKVGQSFGVLPTLLGVIVSAALGAAVIRMQGLSLMADIRATMGRGQLPGRAIADAMMVFLAGVLLLIPGYFTDFVGILLLLPPVRELIYGYLKTRMVVVSSATSRPGAPPSGPRTIELDDDDYHRLR
jgi:UPF0716 protein FxsA